jgi:hypothetical protein
MGRKSLPVAAAQHAQEDTDALRRELELEQQRSRVLERRAAALEEACRRAYRMTLQPMRTREDG